MLLLIRFSRRRLRAFVMPSFLLHVFAKLPLIFSLESGCIGGSYLNEIRLRRGIFILFHNKGISQLLRQATGWGEQRGKR